MSLVKSISPHGSALEKVISRSCWLNIHCAPVLDFCDSPNISKPDVGKFIPMSPKTDFKDFGFDASEGWFPPTYPKVVQTIGPFLLVSIPISSPCPFFFFTFRNFQNPETGKFGKCSTKFRIFISTYPPVIKHGRLEKGTLITNFPS